MLISDLFAYYAYLNTYLGTYLAREDPGLFFVLFWHLLPLISLICTYKVNSTLTDVVVPELTFFSVLQIARDPSYQIARAGYSIARRHVSVPWPSFYSPFESSYVEPYECIANVFARWEIIRSHQNSDLSRVYIRLDSG